MNNRMILVILSKLLWCKPMSVYYEGCKVIYISLHRNPGLDNTVKSDITLHASVT